MYITALALRGAWLSTIQKSSRASPESGFLHWSSRSESSSRARLPCVISEKSSEANCTHQTVSKSMSKSKRTDKDNREQYSNTTHMAATLCCTRLRPVGLRLEALEASWNRRGKPAGAEERNPRGPAIGLSHCFPGIRTYTDYQC